MKKISFLLFVGSLNFLPACNNNGTLDSLKNAKEANVQKDSGVTEPYDHTPDSVDRIAILPVDKDAANFAVDIANSGMIEIALGNYVQQNAMDQRVKNFGAMMVKDHTKANEELQNIAAAKNITLPTSIGNSSKKDIQNLMKKKGKDLDKAYMNMMLNDHEKEVRSFEKNAKDCKDVAIKSFTIRTLPLLLIHLDSAKAITGKQ